jgi:OOP family OmpA-OmpF porin
VLKSTPSLTLALFGATLLASMPVLAAEPDEDDAESSEEATDDESPPEDVPNPEGSEPEEDDDDGGDKKKKKKGKKKSKGAKVEVGGDAKGDPLLPPDRTSGKRAKAYELKKPWIKRWAPERDMLDIGVFIGGLFLPSSHGLFDAGDGPRPPLKRSAFDGGMRLAYMPLSFLGLGLEIDGASNRGGTPETSVSHTNFRMHVIGQLPYRITPVFVIGGGFLSVRSGAAILNELDGAFHYGLGLKVHINQWIAVRMDGRHMVASGDFEGDRASYGEIQFGVDLNLRMRRLVKPKKIDRDGDGLYDRDDACPHEAGDGDDGCPKNKDTDKDGVIDRNDKCPKEYGDDPKGCPIPDKDGDGILDSKDDCWEDPETFNGFEDTNGCPDEPPEKLKKLDGVIAGITFDSGQATIRTSSRRVLAGVVSTLKEFPDVRIEIVGHTDDQGSREINTKLSAARADAVKTYLVEQGIDAGRITTKGVGPDEPIADNKTKAGRAKNRRIEFKIAN